jgi:hypothetical protein
MGSAALALGREVRGTRRAAGPAVRLAGAMTNRALWGADPLLRQT